MKIVSVEIKEKKGNVFFKKFNVDDLKIFFSKLNSHDYNFIKFIYSLGEDELILNAKIYKRYDSFYIETTKDYKYWILKVSEKNLFYFIESEKIIHMIKNPKKFNFIKQTGYKVVCTGNISNRINNIDSIIKCLDKLDDNMIYIYNYDTNRRFTIEMYSNKYSISLSNYYRDFDKSALISFFRKYDMKIFSQIEKNPENFGFTWVE